MSKIAKALGRIEEAKRSADYRERPQNRDRPAPLTNGADRHVSFKSRTAMNKRVRIDRKALSDAGLVAPAYHAQKIANQYRDIKRPLIAQALGKGVVKIHGGNLIMVSSALSGEGKTFTSINLALSMAEERDYSILLVDADVAKPQVTELFGCAGEAGLLDALEERNSQAHSMILPTDVDNLSILPAGKPRYNATELLASRTMEKLTSQLSQLSPRQLVIFDSPPLLRTSEAKVLTSLVGQIVVVVKADETSQDAVSTAVRKLDPDKAVNLVLNQVRSVGVEYEYGYGYQETTQPNIGIEP